MVAHAGLNQEEHWQYFKHETEEAQVLADLDAQQLSGPGPDADDTSSGDEATSQPRDTDPAEVTDEEIEGFDVDAYLPVEGDDAEEAKEHLRDVEDALEALEEKGLDVPDADAFRREIAARNQPSPPLSGEDLPPPPNRPAYERRAYRKILNHAVRRAAGTVLRRLDISEGTDLVDAVGKGEEQSNVEVVIRLLHRRVNAAVGRDDDAEGRNGWPLAALKEARTHVAEVRDAVLDNIAAATDYTASGPPSDRSAPVDPAPPSSADSPDETDSPDEDDAFDDFDWGDPFGE